MNDHFTKKLSALKHEHLSEAERSALRARVVAMTAMTATPVVSPFRFYKHRRSVAVVGVASLFLLSAGASFAAETALPGDTLYPVKVQVNEGVQRVLARTPEAKASVAKKEVERRAVEVETLVKEERLDAAAKAQLRGDTSDSLRSFSTAQASLVKAGKVKEAKDRERDLRETIARHREALSVIGVEDREGEDDSSTGRGRGNRNREELRAVATSTSKVGSPLPREDRSGRRGIVASSSVSTSSPAVSEWSDDSRSDSREDKEEDRRPSREDDDDHDEDDE